MERTFTEALNQSHRHCRQIPDREFKARCPECDSDLEYNGQIKCSNIITFTFTCKECGCEFDVYPKVRFETMVTKHGDFMAGYREREAADEK